MIVRATAGEPEAKAQIVREYQELVYNLALKLVGDADKAENVLQDTFLNIFEKLDAFRGDSSLKTWIYRIATNSALMSLRQRKGQTVTLEEEAEPSASSRYQRMMESLSQTPLDILLDAEFREALQKAMSELPDSWRIPFVLKDIEGLSLQEVADSLNTTIPAVKAALHRGRTALRDQLAEFIETKDRGKSGKEKFP